MNPKAPIILLQDGLMALRQAFHERGGGIDLFLLVLTCLLIAAKAQSSDLVFEKIKHSLPQNEAGWRILEAEEPCRQVDGSWQVGYVWAKDGEEVRATVIRHRSSKTARDEFRRVRKGEPSMAGFLVDGLGDEAYLFPPIILNQAGPFNLRLRKGPYEILMSAHAKDTITRCARYIVDAISR